MNMNQHHLISLLSIAIRQDKMDNSKIANIDWNITFKLAKEQNIFAILYSTVKNLDEDIKPNKEIMSEWKKQTILAGLVQIQNINKIGLVLKEFKNKSIQVMALKGLIFREMYPSKELRNMGDNDLLIHKNDLDDVKEILLQMGYYEDHSDLKHTLFLNENCLPIEVHWLLIDTNHFKHAVYLEKEIWENALYIDIGGTKVLKPSVQNQILHMFLHMVVHFIYSGFGLRQLCDLVLFVETKEDEIDWNGFAEGIQECKINNFVITIFEVCRRLFDLSLPEKLYENKIFSNQFLNNRCIDSMIYNIFSGGIYGGTYGKKNFVLVDDNLLSYYENQGQVSDIRGKIKYLIKLFFPSPQRLNGRYNYARKYNIVLPIAWIHRLVYGIIRKDQTTDEKKIRFSFNSDKLRERAELFKWLGL